MPDPIYKTKDGQRVTKSQLLNSGYSEDRITKGLGGGILTLVGDTQTPSQLFKTQDGQSVTTEDLLNSGYSQERIDKGVQNGILSPDESIKKKGKESPVVSAEAGADFGYSSSSGISNISPSTLVSSSNPATEKINNHIGGQLPSELNSVKAIGDISKPAGSAVAPNSISQDPIGDNINENQKIIQDNTLRGLDKDKPSSYMGQDYADRMDKIKKAKENIQQWQSAFNENSQVAEKWLVNRFQQKGVSLIPSKKPIVSDPTKPSIDLSFLSPNFEAKKVLDGNLGDFPIEQIRDHIDTNNKTDVNAFNVLKRNRDVKEALSNAPDIYTAALTYAKLQDPKFAAQDKFLSGDIPDVLKGAMISDFINNPTVQKMSVVDPEFGKKIQEADYNLSNDFPEYGKKVVSQKISQYREDAGLNNPILNIPRKGATDDVVEEMINKGILSERDRIIYDKQIRPDLGLLQSLKRGVGRMIPFVQANMDESPIATPGALEGFENSAVNTLHGMARSVEDVTNVVTRTVGTGKIFGTNERLYNILAKNYSTITVDPHNFFNEFGQSAGNITGFVAPMILGGVALRGLGMGPMGSEIVNNTLMFESPNKDRALEMFPGQGGKQFAYTAIATPIDVFLGHLIPNKNIVAGMKGELSKDVVKVINDFTDEKITAAAAKKTIVDKLSFLVKDKIPQVIADNTKTGAIMTGFDIVHNGLDAAFGGRNINLDDAANSAVQTFKNGFLGSTFLSAFGKTGVSPSLSGKIVRELASNHDITKSIIEEQAALSPKLDATKNERIANLNDAAKINKDIEGLDLTEKQKQKYLLNALAETVYIRKAEATNNETIKNGYLEKAAEHKKIQEGIYKNEDTAPEFQPIQASELTPKPSPVFTDFDGTVFQGDKLTPLGQQLKARVSRGEDITVLTAREDTPENKKFIAEQLGISEDKIKAGLSPEGKAKHITPGSTFYDNNPDNLKAAKDTGATIVNTALGENALFDKIQENATDSFSSFNVNPADKQGTVDFVKQQALSAPASVMDSLKGNEELTTDLIADNGKEKIQEQIDLLTEEKNNIKTDDLRTEDIDRHLALLNEGLKKAQPKEKASNTDNVETDKAVMGGVKTDYIENENGEKVKLPSEGYLIDGVYLKEGQEKGKGSGQELYKKALDEHGVLYSHWPISEDAMRVHDKLVEKGIAKVENITLSDGTELRKITKTPTPKGNTDNVGKGSGAAVVMPEDNKHPDVIPLIKSVDAVDKEVPPSGEPPAGVEPTPEDPEKEWTAIRKEKQIEIDKVKQTYEKQEKQTWSHTLNQGLERVQSEYPNDNLFDASKKSMDVLYDRMQSGKRMGGDEKDEAVMQNLKRELSAKIAATESDRNSPDEIKRNIAMLQANGLMDDLAKTAMVIKGLTTTGGRVLQYAQSELAFDPQHGLQLRRMQLQQSNGGEPLDEAQLESTAKDWAKEKEAIDKVNELRAQRMQEEFDARIQEIHKHYQDTLAAKKGGMQKAPESANKKTLSQKGKDAADRIRKGKIGGTQSVLFPGVKQGINFVIETIATAVEAGATVAEAITDFIKTHVEKGKEKEFKSAFLDHIYSANRNMDAMDSIKEAAANGEKDITIDMVAKNQVKDFVESYVGSLEPKDIIGQATEDLKSILPDVTKDKLMEAYLKNGDYTIPTKEKLESDFEADKKELVRLTKLEQDLSDLETMKELRQRSFPTQREKSDAERELLGKKTEILNKRKAEKKQLEKDIATIEKEKGKSAKEAEAKKKKLQELDNNIRSIEKGGDLLKKAATRSDRELDKDIEAKKEELNQALIYKGKKLGREDSYTKASFTTRAELHNERLQGISDELKKQEYNPDLSQEERDSLFVTRQKIEAAKIALNQNSKLSQEPLMDYALTRLKEISNEFNKENKSESSKESKRLIQRAIDKFDRDKNDAEMMAKLQRVKERIKNQNKERERKINAGEFDEKKPIILKKTDAELIKATIERDNLESQFNYERRKLESKTRSFGRKVADFGRSLYVTALIYKFGTLAKVAATSLIRPNVEAGTKAIFGNLFKNMFPDFAERAKAGGEGSSLKTIQKIYEAYIMNVGENKLAKKFKDANDKYEAASKEYESYKNGANPDPQKEQDLKNKADGALIDAIGNSIYQYIGGSSVKDALDALFHRSNKIEREFGFLEQEGYKNIKQFISLENENIFDKVKYVLEFVGRSHSAIKSFSGRANFAAGFISRLEYAHAHKEDISNPDKILEIANESYLDWDRGKYQQKNYVSDKWNKLTRGEREFKGGPWEKTDNIVSSLMKFDLPITRVPVNLLHEAVMEYTLGAFTSLYKVGKEYFKAGKEAKAEGYDPGTPEFKESVKDYISKLDKDQAAAVARAFRKGGFGLGLFALLAIGGVLQYGGFHHRGERKTKDKNGLLPGDIEVAGVKMPKLIGKIIEHIPGLFPALLGANTAQVYNDKIIKRETTKEAALDAIMADLQYIQDQIPQTKVINPIGLTKDVTRSFNKQIVQPVKNIFK